MLKYVFDLRNLDIRKFSIHGTILSGGGGGGMTLTFYGGQHKM